VGLGGRFDSTNVIVPEACAITNIDFDHTQYLGDTLEAIAVEKAGVIKRGRPVVLGEIAPDPRRVILARAKELACPVHAPGREYRYTVDGPRREQVFCFENDVLAVGPTRLGLAGRYQGQNAATAVALATAVTPRFPKIDAQAIVEGLAAARWPCRLEQVLDDPPVVIDVAHNAAGARTLAETVAAPCVVVLAVSNDKDAAGMIEALEPITHALILTQFTGRRALAADRLAAAAGGRTHCRVASLAEAIERGLEQASQDHPLLIAGSIFTAGEARQILIDRHGAPPLEF